MGLRLFKRVFDELDRGFVRAVPKDAALALGNPRSPMFRPSGDPTCHSSG